MLTMRGCSYKRKTDTSAKQLKIWIIITACAMCLAVLAMVFLVIKTLNTKNEEKAVLPTSSQSFDHTEVLSADQEKKLLMLVNFDHQISVSFKLDLVDFKGVKCDSLVVNSLTEMLNDAKQAGFDLSVARGYIDKDTQQQAHNALLEIYKSNGMSAVSAEEEASKNEPLGGCSDMQTGLSVDIIKAGTDLDSSFSETAEYKWLSANCVNYGFILRYPKEKESDTKVYFNPNRYRYVGVENAQKMRRLDMSLEKYYEYVNSRE